MRLLFRAIQKRKLISISLRDGEKKPHIVDVLSLEHPGDSSDGQQREVLEIPSILRALSSSLFFHWRIGKLRSDRIQIRTRMTSTSDFGTPPGRDVLTAANNAQKIEKKRRGCKWNAPFEFLSTARELIGSS